MPTTSTAAATTVIAGTEQSRFASNSPTAQPNGVIRIEPATHSAATSDSAQRAIGSARPPLLTIGQYDRGVPAYSRMDVDERRSQLLEVGTQLFSTHSYEELSMAQIARAAGISKALLYHYFPSKDEFFKAALTEAATELAERTAPDESQPPEEQIRNSTRAFVGWIGERGDAYVKLLQSVGAVPELRETMSGIRDFTSARILEGLVPESGGARGKRAAVRAWLWFMDGVLLDWIEHGDRDADAVTDQLTDSLVALLA